MRQISVSDLKARLSGEPVRTRFAPSPTGYLHLGHVVNAIYVWGVARALGGEVVLRMEDHDRDRCRPEYEAAILEDLAWLGLEADRGALSFSKGTSDFRQSDCGRHFENAMDRLRAQGLVYACDCSRRVLRGRLMAFPGEEVTYDGYCRDRRLEESGDVALRLRLSEEEVVFDDLLLGRQIQVPAMQSGDLVPRDRKGNWTYQLAVVVDDLRHGVNLVVRGADILPSTGRQQLLARALGEELNVGYVHHGLLLDPDGVKLSKRHFSKDIHQLMQVGEDPEMVLGEAAALAGLIPERRGVGVAELASLVCKK